MKRPILFRKPAGWLLALTLAALLLGPGVALGQNLKATQSTQSLYSDPNFASTPLTSVPGGAEVNVVSQSGDWYQVEYQGKTGYLHRQAFPQAQTPSKFGLPGLLFGAPVRETKSDEVALAGKGFTPEVESSYRQQHPEMKFAQVDQVEAFQVDEGKLKAFIQEGGLKP